MKLILSYGWPLILALIVALGLIITGVYGGEWVAGCTSATCNAVRSLQWETLTAGFLGLAGGVAVIVMTRYQLHESRKAAVNMELLDVDALILAFADCENKVWNAVERIRGIIKDGDPTSFSKADKEIHLAVYDHLPDRLYGAVCKGYRLPVTLRLSARRVHEAFVKLECIKFESLPSTSDYTSIEQTFFGFAEQLESLQKLIENLKFERDRFAEILLKR